MGVGEGALVPGTMFQQYPAIVKNIVKAGQAEKAGVQTGDLLSSISGISLIGKQIKDAIKTLRKQKRPMKLKFRRRFVPDPAWPRIKYPRIPQAHMGWLECEFDDVHYGHIRYWWKIDTHHLTIIPPPPFAALEQARKEALMYQPRSPEMKQREALHQPPTRSRLRGATAPTPPAIMISTGADLKLKLSLSGCSNPEGSEQHKTICRGSQRNAERHQLGCVSQFFSP